MDKIGKIFLFILAGVCLLTQGYSLETYVGVKIENLTDDPSISCVGEFDASNDPHNQGKIRAISSIVGNQYSQEYPIYFELRRDSDNSLVWSGDSTEDTDYEVGDTIYLPQTVNLNSGTDYRLFMDVDAIRFYYPIESSDSNEFERTQNNEYWFAGLKGTGNGDEYSVESAYGNHCEFRQYAKWGAHNNIYFSNNRSSLNNSCAHDGIDNNCDEKGFMGTNENNYYDIGNEKKYNHLHNSTKGNFEILFTQP